MDQPLETESMLSPWGRAWRALIGKLPPDPCDCDYCNNNKPPSQEVFQEWEPAFDSFSDLDDTNKFLGAGGEGCGKTHHSSLFAVARTRWDQLTLKNNPSLVWIIGADFEDAYAEFEDILRFEEYLGAVESHKIAKGGRDQCIIYTTRGLKYSTISAKDPTKIARETVDGIIGSEISRWPAEAFDRAFSRIARQKHAWFFGSGSFETDMGAFYSWFDAGQGPNNNRLRSMSIPSWANPHLYPLGLGDPRIQERRVSMSDAKFQERFMGKPASPKAAVISNFRRETHVMPLTVDETFPVMLWADPGTLVYAVLFVQVIDGQVRVLDEVYSNASTHDSIVDRVRMNPLWKYVTGEGCVMDAAGKAHHMGNPSAIEHWRKKTGINFSTSAGMVPVEDKAERVISLFNINPDTGRPFTIVDPKCKGLIAESGGGGTSPTAEYGGGVWMRAVGADGSVGDIKRRNDHACSALAYGGIHMFGLARPGRRQRAAGPIVYGGPQQRPDYYRHYPDPGRVNQTNSLNTSHLSRRRKAARVY